MFAIMEPITTEEPIHQRCFACGRANVDGLKLTFSARGDGKIGANFTLGDAYQGYPGMVQGGIIATVLDSAMTNYLFSQGVTAMTVRLNVQYRQPVLVGELLTVEAELIRKRGRLYELKACLFQAGCLKALASAKFMVPKDVI